MSILISAIMPVYNAEPFLSQAIESVLNQSLQEFELICVNDGSTDNSLTILNRYASIDPRIRVISRDNYGIPRTRNEGVKASRGDFLAWLDADDIAEPRWIEKQLHFLESYPSVVAVGCQLSQVDEELFPVEVWSLPLDHHDIDYGLLNGMGGRVTQSACLMRKDAVLNVGGYNEAYPYAEDYDLFLRLAEHGKLANLPEVLVRRRLHPHSITTILPSQTLLVHQIINETCKRRGIEPSIKLDLSPQGHACQQQRPDPNSVYYHNSMTIAYKSLVAGHLKTSIKHARRANDVKPGLAPRMLWLAACSGPLFSRVFVSMWSVVKQVKAFLTFPFRRHSL